MRLAGEDQTNRRALSKETNPRFLLSARAAGDYDPPDIPGNTVIDTTQLTGVKTAQSIYEALSAAMR